MKTRLCSVLTAIFLLACGGESSSDDPTPTPAPPPTTPPTTQPKPPETGFGLWIDEESLAAQDARAQKNSSLSYIAAQPMAQWLGEWSGDIEKRMAQLSRRGDAAQKMLTLVLYHIPYRDCGSYSAGGSEPSAYRQWVTALARGLGQQPALIIIEPDALAGMECLPTAARDERLVLLKDAVKILKSAPNARLYLDAGHPAWQTPEVMADRLRKAGLADADGFALNVSNFQTLDANVSYGQKLRDLVGGKNFVIDTSRNGNGPDAAGTWCNPRGRALGMAPTLQTGLDGVAAFLWVKRPGESDGSCNGGPAAGQWWREIALEMAKGAGH